MREEVRLEHEPEIALARQHPLGPLDGRQDVGVPPSPVEVADTVPGLGEDDRPVAVQVESLAARPMNPGSAR